MRLQNMKLRNQLMSGFALALGVVVLAVLVTFSVLSKVSDGLDAVVRNRYPKVMMTQSIIKRVIDNGRLIRGAVLTTDAKQLDELIKKIKAHRAANAEDFDKLDKTVKNPQAREDLGKMVAARDKIGPIYDQ